MNSMSGEKLKGIPYTGTLPAVITGTKAGYLHSYKIFGNTEQTGTPTPENPIVPSECGERTGNLYDESTLLNGYYDTTSYQYYPNDNYRCFSLSLPVGTYTIFAESDVLTIRLLRVSSASLGANPVNRDNQSYTFTLSVAETIYVSLRNSTSTNDFTGLTIMLNLGLLALPYEPYGYKLPLLSGSTPVDIYLGESQTTRRIKKLVLTGTEVISSVTESTLETGAYCFAYLYSYLGMTEIIDYDIDMRTIPYPQYVSDHFKMRATPTQQAVLYTDLYAGEMGANTRRDSSGIATFNRYIIFCVSGISTANDFKAWLASQYANGTPVTIWYVLATEETGTLNEPLRKIGNYADTIDSTQTSAQIPTTANSTTISWAGEGLAPSQFDSIQEWVDIPTYTYTSGEWVADNSN